MSRISQLSLSTGLDTIYLHIGQPNPQRATASSTSTSSPAPSPWSSSSSISLSSSLISRKTSGPVHRSSKMVVPSGSKGAAYQGIPPCGGDTCLKPLVDAGGVSAKTSAALTRIPSCFEKSAFSMMSLTAISVSIPSSCTCSTVSGTSTISTSSPSSGLAMPVSCFCSTGSKTGSSVESMRESCRDKRACFFTGSIFDKWLDSLDDASRECPTVAILRAHVLRPTANERDQLW
ncbi:hypothetical protein KCU88_g432, partial [Aureobasidium melanogenum]